MEKNLILRSFGTHSGTFHADEVTACALLLLYDCIDLDKIIRTRDHETLCHLEYVCDVGGVFNPKIKRFDHHQQEYQGSLSSAGMILSYLHNLGKIEEGKYLYLKDKLVDGIDAIDNGFVDPIPGHATFSSIIANFVPTAYDASDREIREAFEAALQFTLGHLRRLIEKYDYVQGCKDEVEKEMEKEQDCLVFDRAMPWMEAFFQLGGEHHKARCVIMPSGNHWKLRGIPPTYQDRMRVRSPLPASWAGLLEKELKEITQIKGAIFCHKGLFISVWQTKEDAIKAYEKVK